MHTFLRHRLATMTLLVLGTTATSPAFAEYVWLQRHAQGELRAHYGELVDTGHGHSGHGHTEGGVTGLLRSPEILAAGSKAPLQMRADGDDGVVLGAPAQGDARLAQLTLEEGKTIAVRYVAQGGVTARPEPGWDSNSCRIARAVTASSCASMERPALAP